MTNFTPLNIKTNRLKPYLNQSFVTSSNSGNTTYPITPSNSGNKGGMAQWLARLTHDRWVPASREFEPHQRPPLFL